MTNLKKSISIILAAVMLLSVFVVVPVTASAAASIKHEAFEVRSPLKSGYYDVNEKMSIEIYRKKWIAKTVNGFLQDDYNYIYVDVCKDNVVKKRFEVNIYHKWNLPGTTAIEYFTPTETGVYTLRVGFATSDVEREFLRSFTKDKITDETYVGSVKFNVVKRKANTLTVKTAAKSLKAAALKKAKKTVKPVSIKKAKGAVKVVKIKKGTSSKIYKKITVAKKTGAITFKKGTYKKGTYKVKLKVTAAGNKTYKAKSKTVTVKIKVK